MHDAIAPRPTSLSEPVISLRGVGKMYKVYDSKSDNMLDALGLARLLRGRVGKHKEFWALRGIDLELQEGRRIGIVGRNGAGKSTLLKLITGNLAPTEGTLRTRGKIEALISPGAGFHPDLTGVENVRAALTYQGFSPRQIREVEADIADFTELGEFLYRPFRTYSSGMMARLIFATATAIRPKVLIIDEVLGAGDAYFIGKSSERMRELVESGASILLVSHATDQITRLCNDAIWLERGMIVESGPALEVVKAYTKFIRQLEDRRLRARNRKAGSGRELAREQMDSYTETLMVRFLPEAGAACSVTEVRLWRDGEMEDVLNIGSPQDTDRTHSSFLIDDGNEWSAPETALGRMYRSLSEESQERVGAIAFNLFTVFPESDYSLEITHRCQGAVHLEVWHAGTLRRRSLIEGRGSGWEPITLRLGPLGSLTGTEALTAPEDRTPAAPQAGPAPEPATRLSVAPRPKPRPSSPTRWPGEGSLLIEGVRLTGDSSVERGVFETDAELRIGLDAVAQRTGSFSVTPVAVLYRLDGVRLFSHIGEPVQLSLQQGERRRLTLRIAHLNLGCGRYAFALALYRKLSSTEASEWYDLIDRDYQFEVTGDRGFGDLYKHPGEWSVG